MKTQKHPIGNDFNAAIMQENLTNLFQDAHNHGYRTTEPTVKEGNIGDIVLVKSGANVYICIKIPSGWFKTAALTSV